jgi:hypothetical protein
MKKQVKKNWLDEHTKIRNFLYKTIAITVFGGILGSSGLWMSDHMKDIDTRWAYAISAVILSTFLYLAIDLWNKTKK